MSLSISSFKAQQSSMMCLVSRWIMIPIVIVVVVPIISSLVPLWLGDLNMGREREQERASESERSHVYRRRRLLGSPSSILFKGIFLYPEDESGPMSTKKPVIVESYDEIVFPEGSEAFLAHVQNHPAMKEESRKTKGETKDHPLSQWFTNYSEPNELLQLATARQELSYQTLLFAHIHNSMQVI
ncbi:hypothetical protein UlMin_026050 [Ulmus minor]